MDRRLLELAETDSRLDALLRGEIAAAETFAHVIQRLERSEDRALSTLRELRDDHVEAANTLRRLVTTRGREAARDSGAWGAFAKAVEGAASLLGARAAVLALKEGEEHGVRAYERVLERNHLDPTVRRVLETTLLPRQRAHVPRVDRLLASS